MEGLKRARVIRRRGIFKEAREKGRRPTNRWLVLNALSRPPEVLQDPKRQDIVAFITPKKLGPAHLRNRIRRLMREVFRQFVIREPGLEKHFLVWVARSPVLELDFEGLKRAMIELRNKVRP
jgi:ribonuclease P protein component